MKLAILGATGNTGSALVHQALKAGHQVIALVRDPTKIKTEHENLEVKVANVFSVESLKLNFEGCDAVLSCLGGVTAAKVFRAVTFYSESVKTITEAMKQANVNRFVCMTSQGIQSQQGEPAIIKMYRAADVFIGRNMRDMMRMEQFLFDQEYINYTIIRPPKIVNKESCGNVKKVEGYIVPDSTARVPFVDVADVMLSVLNDNTWDRKGVAISS